MADETPEARLQRLGLTLPAANAPVGSYVPTVQAGGLLFVSGQIGARGADLVHPGTLGDDVTIEQGYEAARCCALSILAHAKNALGELSRVKRVVRLGGFVKCTPAFNDAPKVVNGASDLLKQVFGEQGNHARAAVGVAALPRGACVEVDAILEITQ